MRTVNRKRASLLNKLFLATLIIILALFYLPTKQPLSGAEGNAMLAFFGRFHIVFLHLPIAWIVLVPFMEWVVHKTPSALNGLRLVLLLAAISALITATMGLTLAYTDGYSGDAVEFHMWMGVSTTCIIMFTWLSREVLLAGWTAARYLYPVLLFASLVFVGVTGHLGGDLVQGKGFLTERLPVPVKDLLGIAYEKPIVITQQSNIFDDVINPLLKDSCAGCHNRDKRKGKFSMATHALLLKGGDSGQPAIVPGDPQQSPLIHRIELPRDDEDAMPPEERDPLSERDIELITWWVSIDAPTQRRLEDLGENEYPENIRTIIEELMAAQFSTDLVLPAYDADELLVLAASLKADFGLDVQPVSRKATDGLRVSSFNTDKRLGADALKALLPVAEYIRSLDFSGAVFSGDEFEAIQAFVNLEKLTLKKAMISTADLLSLQALSLRSLNLFGTRLYQGSVENLATLDTLQHLYIGNSGLSRTELREVANALTGCEVLPLVVDDNPVISGGYQYLPDRLVIPAGVRIKNAHSLARDARDTIYLAYESRPLEDATRAIMQFNAHGRFEKFIGSRALAEGRPHGLELSNEGDKRYFYLSNTHHTVRKLNMDGSIVWQQDGPPDHPVYANDDYRPTGTAVDHGSKQVYIADGYAGDTLTNREIYSGEFKGDLWDGSNSGKSFDTPHGLTFDARPGRQRLIVSDRGNKRILFYDQEGVFQSELTGFGISEVSNTDVQGPYLLITNLDGSVVILNEENETYDVIEIGKLLGEFGHQHPHDAIFLSNGDIVIATWNPGHLSYWQRLNND